MADDITSPETPDVVAMAHRFYRESRDHTSEWRTEAREAYDMAAGKQWSADDLAKLKEQQRPAVTFNRIARTLNAVIGTQVANRQETRFIPREQGDAQVNEVLTAAAEWVRDETDAEDEESDAFEDMGTCGMGWTETRLDYESDPDGMVRIERVDPLEMYWDPGAQKRNLSDARWVMRVRRMSLDEFEAQWPDADKDAASAPWEDIEDETSKRTHVYPQDAYKSEQARRGGTKGKRTVRVAHLQWAEQVTSYRVGKRAERLSADKFEKLKDGLEKRGIKSLKQQGVTWRQAFVAGGAVLEEDASPFPDGPTFRAMTYKRDRNENTWFGLVRSMSDPQRFGNKFFSQILDILNKGAKGGVMIEADAVEDVRKFEETWARPDAVHTVRPGALSGNKIQPKQQVAYPQGLDRLMTFSMDAVHEVTGVNLELLGFANREQAGVLEDTRKRSGLTILAPLFDALRRYRKEQGRVLLHFIQEYISDGRLVRVVGKNGTEQYVPLAKQPETAKYDVIVDESPTSPNMKERVFGALVELLPTIGKMGVPIPPEVLDYAPIPSGLAQKWKEQIEAAPQIPPQMQKQMEDMGKQVQQLTEENRALKDKREETAAELQMKMQESQATLTMKAQEQQMETQLAVAEHQAKLQALEREYELRARELTHKMQLAELEAGIRIKIDETKAGADIQRANVKADADTARADKTAEATVAIARTKAKANPKSQQPSA